MMREHGMNLTEIVEVVRDTRRLSSEQGDIPFSSFQLLDGYKHKSLMEKIAQVGISVKNHKSTSRYLNAVLRAIRKGQDAGQYLVLNISGLENCCDLQLSPLGTVEKKNCDPDEEVRVIHDLSFPRGKSTNDISDGASPPEIECENVATIAQRIERCHARFRGVLVKPLKRDVEVAFRHLMVASGNIRWMAATIPKIGVLIIGMSAPFGCTCSPAYYGIFGGAISWLVGRESPASLDPNTTDNVPFFAYEWVDDHVLAEPDIANRLHIANETVRLAMLAVLGPTAINEENFSTWETKLQVLGLTFVTAERTISMPQDKIDEAVARVRALQNNHHTSKTELQQFTPCLLVPACCKTTLPAASICIRTPPPRYGKIPVDGSLRQDEYWFETILTVGHFRDLALATYADITRIDVHLYMDASNVGLVNFNPATRQYNQVPFDVEEQEVISKSTGSDGFNINVQKQLCIAFAPMLFVRAWSDNTSAVAWINRLHSANAMAQEINRAIGLAEAIPLSPNLQKSSHPTTIPRIGLAIKEKYAVVLVARTGSVSGCLQNNTNTLISSLCSPFITGAQGWPQRDLTYQLKLYCPQLATFRGIICATTDTPSASTPDTTLLDAPVVATTETDTSCHRGNPVWNPWILRLQANPRLRPQGVAVMGFFFMLRRSEYLADGTRPYIIRFNDISFTAKHVIPVINLDEAIAITIRFRGSKTDQVGSGVTRTLYRSGSRWLCPVLAVWQLVQSSRSFGHNEALCATRIGKVLKADHLSEIIKTAREINAEPSQFGTHSMRSCGATALFAAGVDNLTMKTFGRWASDAFKRHTRMNDTVSRSLSLQVTQGARSRVSPVTPEGFLQLTN
ncbi:LOW QUALITY PROTEIN: hypothetical protein PHMEG_0009238 [Phytophthora megakarya]|uniref:Tyr recombinase domain-containing protein n=1 Tax=Phytophthora megakarya TaxID=4795 RepID=A0A225WH13_9STRA|nr:LOW QUALITY PROTEIN: hypothetical protein PHMEG_0009238 [Phytophthora megakarya]